MIVVLAGARRSHRRGAVIPPGGGLCHFAAGHRRTCQQTTLVGAMGMTQPIGSRV